MVKGHILQRSKQLANAVTTLLRIPSFQSSWLDSLITNASNNHDAKRREDVRRRERKSCIQRVYNMINRNMIFVYDFFAQLAGVHSDIKLETVDCSVYAGTLRYFGLRSRHTAVKLRYVCKVCTYCTSTIDLSMP